MKNANIILSNVIKQLPESKRTLARNVLECRFLAQLNTQETAHYLGVSYNTVVDILKSIKAITKGKTLSDFVTA